MLPAPTNRPEGSRRGRVLAAVSVLSGVCLIGAGIAQILRNDYIPRGGYAGAFLAPAAIVLGSVLLFIPLYWRLSRDSEMDDSR